MADFQQLKNQQREMREAGRQAARARERERSLMAQIANLQRSANPNNPKVLDEIQRLNARAKAAGADRRHAASQFEAVKGRLEGVWKQILPLTDPRERINAWPDRIPILLFPLRLETRFKRNTTNDPAGGPSSELWVRIYPDDCLIDTFEEDLTEMERESARRYWSFFWAAAGDESRQRAAWRDLVAAHGSGRSGWIIEHYQPLNPFDVPPVPAPEGDFYLVIPAQESEPLGADADAIGNFWKNVFLKNETALNASELAQKYPPANLGASAPEGADIKIVFARFPTYGTENSKPFSWSEAPKVKLLPERFVFLGYRGDQQTPAVTAIGNLVQTPLSTGPNPSAEKNDQFSPTDGGDLQVPEEIQWMTDFDEAVAKGMGLRIPLDTISASRGFDRVMVIGVRLGSDAAEGSSELEELLRHHLFGRSGFAVVPQGTPTNNTEDQPSGFSRADDPDESFSIFVKKENQFKIQTEASQKSDGQWLAEALGIGPELLQKTPNADQHDRAEAQAMNEALFPATIGYWMQKMMDPVFKQESLVEKTRQFFTRYVSGRGPLPAIRIGRQPYGIQLATAYSQSKWFIGRRTDVVTASNQQDPFLSRLYQLLIKLDVFWKNMSANVPHVGRPTENPQQQLLDIVDLHPTSVEYYARYGHSLSFLYNFFIFAGVHPTVWMEALRRRFLQAADTTLTELGYSGESRPKIFEKYYRASQNLLHGPVVDDLPLSETQPIRVYAENNKNYIEWLEEAASAYEDKLLPEAGLVEQPRAMLYRLLRHAVIEEYDNVGHRAQLEAQFLQPSAYLTAIAREPEFLHIQPNNNSESRFAQLLNPLPQITGNQQPFNRFIAAEIQKDTPVLNAFRSLQRVRNALQGLKNLPTARLERLLAEHIDCCSYRHDAWVQGFMNLQLDRIRPDMVNQEDDNGEAVALQREGIYLGAYGWIENLRPEGKTAEPVRLPNDLGQIFQRPEDPPLARDVTNQGYIHAPSLNHAVTAAVLRNGYLSNATPSQPGLLAVNLSSERVRKALETLEGIRNGQSLGALLGYRFERSLHDRNPAMFVFSYQLRKAFPLVANRLQNTQNSDPESQEAIAARNVVDGYRLLKKALENNNTPNFSFLTDILKDPAPNASQRSFIEATILDLIDIHDALSDLGIAESVHQIVQGNFDRAAANLDAYSKATFPQTPDVVITPRSGITLTHRTAIHLDGQAMAQATDNARCQAEPAIQKWLSSLLPQSQEIAVLVDYSNPGDPEPPTVTETVTLNNLGLQHLDLLYLFQGDQEQSLGVLEERIFRYIFSNPAVHAHAKLNIRFTEPISQPGIKATFFELSPLLRSLRYLVASSRPLRPTDAAPPSEASNTSEAVATLDKTRILSALPNIVLLDNLEADLINPALGADSKIQAFIQAFAVYSHYGIPETGFGFVFTWIQEQYENLIKKVLSRLEIWNEKFLEFKDLIDNQLPLATTDEERFALLRKAEALVSTAFITPLPALVAVFQPDIEQKGQLFLNKKNALEQIIGNLPSTWQQFLNDLSAELPLTDFDAEPFDLIAESEDLQYFVEKLKDKTAALKAVLAGKIGQVNEKIAVYDAPTTPAIKKTEAVQEAGKILFGDDFVMVPQFELPDAQSMEWQNAFNAQNEILKYQISEKKDPFPVDTWFYGCARVREKLRHLENVWMLAEGFGAPTQKLQPVQFPFRQWTPDPQGGPGIMEAEPWLALEYPAAFTIAEEKILYCAVYTNNFVSSDPQCGLLIDEWTEVVPVREETTGLTFHYDRPNTEPVQAWLLAMAPTLGQNWTWEALVAALQETLQLAKQRAVEPAQVEQTTLGVFSPATVFPVTPWAITPSLNLHLINTVKLSS